MKLQFKWFRQHTQIFQLGAMWAPPSRLTSNFKRLITSIGGDTPSVAHAYSPVCILAHIIHTSNEGSVNYSDVSEGSAKISMAVVEEVKFPMTLSKLAQ